MKIVVTSVLVDDQEKALRFYTDVLGFSTKHDIPMGHHRWLTVVSKSDPDGVELLLEPDEHPAAGPFKRALVSDGIPFTSFGVEDVQAGATHPTRRRLSHIVAPAAGNARAVLVTEMALDVENIAERAIRDGLPQLAHRGKTTLVVAEAKDHAGAHTSSNCAFGLGAR